PDQNQTQPAKQGPNAGQIAQQNVPPAPQPAPAPTAVPPQVQTQKQNGMEGEIETQIVSTEPQPASPPAAAPAETARVALVPDHVPFVSNHDRARIRDEYMRAPDHKALATNLVAIAFVT